MLSVFICVCISLTKNINISLIIASIISPSISRAAIIETAIIQGATVAAQPTIHYACNALVQCTVHVYYLPLSSSKCIGSGLPLSSRAT